MFQKLSHLLCACLLPALAAQAQEVPVVGTFQYVSQLASRGISAQARTLQVSSPSAPTYYTLQDKTPGYVPIKTLNYQGNSQGAVEIRDPNNDNLWLTSEMRFAKGALDAHWGLQKTLQYWHDVHNWNSFDNAGSPITNYVNFHNAFIDIDGNEQFQTSNAYWNTFADSNSPTGTAGAITFENGSRGQTAATDLGTIGHEFGHGINYGTARLYFDGEESGPLNEGFADIWGACVSNFAGSAFPTWAGPRDPTSLVLAIPKYYKGNNWDSNLQNVGTTNYNHQNSAVLLYWFYLISVGKSGQNERNEPYCVPGLGIATTEKIVFETEKRLASPTAGAYVDATYNDVYLRSLEVARAFHGAGSVQERAVQEAWYAVGVGPKRPTGYTIAGPTWNCNTTSGTFTLAAPTGGGLALPVADWTISPAGVVSSTPTNGVSSITITQLPWASGVITITASNTCAGVTTVQSSQQVVVGSPSPTGIQGEYNTPPGRIKAYISSVPTAQSYNWYVNNVLQGVHSVSVTFPLSNPGDCDTPEVVEVQAVFAGGCTSQMIQRYFYPNCSARMAGPGSETAPAVYPNPANDYVMVNTSAMRAAETRGPRTAPDDRTISLYDNFGHEVLTRHLRESTYRLETSRLPNGIYTLRVMSGGRAIRQQLVVQH